MQLAGSSSWSLTEGDTQLLHVALYVRDRAALPVPEAPDVPPPLLTRPPAEPIGGDPGPAGEQWLGWWRSLIAARRASRAAHAALDDRPARERMDVARGVRERAFDPPRFASLTGSEALRRLVLEVHEDAVGASNAHRGPEAPLRTTLARDCAERVAARRGVPIGSLHAALGVLPVAGSWSYLAAPGDGLCSLGVARDDAAARAFLTELFSSCPAP